MLKQKYNNIVTPQVSYVTCSAKTGLIIYFETMRNTGSVYWNLPMVEATSTKFHTF